ncbi:MAG: tetratricopeptide repeat protein [Planctomycetota bacterium]|nr:tetratricopeptide repeat protein [Planctomycetota bacterium]
MHPRFRQLLPLISALSLCFSLRAQGAPEASQGPAVVTQKEQSRLRAAAFQAQHEGRFSDAADAFLKLSRAAPAQINWVVSAGTCLGRSGRCAEAVDLLDGARKRFVGAVEVNALLARTLLLQTERDAGVVEPEISWAEAAAICEDVLRRDPTHADCRLLLAQCRYLLGEWDEAQRHADQAVERHPERPGAHVLVGRLAKDRFQLYLAELSKVGDDEAARVQVVKQLHEQRLKARGAFVKAAELDPTRAHPHVALSQLASLDGKRQAARDHLHDALAIDPEVAVDHAQLTSGLDWQARLELYRQLRARYEASAPHPPVQKRRKAAALRFHEGRALLDGLRFDEALEAFLKVREDDPAADNANYYAFLCSYYLDDHDAAERHAATFAQRSAPGFADVLRALKTEQRVQVAAIIQYLADRAFQQKRIGNSRDLNHVTACLKDSADAWNNHAFLCRETGEFERADTSYQYAIQREPDSPQLWNDGGVVLQYHLATPENLKKARQMYEKCLALAGTILADDDAPATRRAAATAAAENAKLNLAALDEQR